MNYIIMQFFIVQTVGMLIKELFCVCRGGGGGVAGGSNREEGLIHS